MNAEMTVLYSPPMIEKPNAIAIVAPNAAPEEIPVV
jgi:hypothetical protein